MIVGRGATVGVSRCNSPRRLNADVSMGGGVASVLESRSMDRRSV
jgi:hypothetical protein